MSDSWIQALCLGVLCSLKWSLVGTRGGEAYRRHGKENLKSFVGERARIA